LPSIISPEDDKPQSPNTPFISTPLGGAVLMSEFSTPYILSENDHDFQFCDP